MIYIKKIKNGEAMCDLCDLFKNNRDWAMKMVDRDPGYFRRLSQQQNPKFLWIGCSDSRVPANKIIGLDPGEVFVHRNVGNVVAHSDLNCLSVIQFAVDVLRVQHIIVTGHYGCGGVRVAASQERLGLIDNWLCHIRDVAWKHREELVKIKDAQEKENRLCELNVIEQASNVCMTSVLQEAWARGQEVTVHGWIYKLHDGLLKDLLISSSSTTEMEKNYQKHFNKSPLWSEILKELDVNQ